jgi:polysaccharide export outer membrane protein
MLLSATAWPAFAQTPRDGGSSRGKPSTTTGGARTGPTKAAAEKARAERPVAQVGDDYIIGRDDLLSIVFWRDDQLSGDVLVRPDGKISLPLLDDIQAAGLTPNQLREQLITEASRFVSNPVASVAVKETNSRRVYITGQVANPGQFPLASSMTVLQLIATAGGLTDFARTKDIRILRVEDGRPTTIRFDYTQVTRPDNPAPNLELRPGDTVIVP